MRVISHKIIISVAVLLSVVFCIYNILNTSLTFDEQPTIFAGYAGLERGEITRNFEHPPLGKQILALPLLAYEIEVDEQDPDLENLHSWFKHSELSYKFLYNWNHKITDELVNSSRLVSVLSLLVLFIVVYRWSKDLGGSSRLALLLCAFSPNLLAYASLVSLDMLLTTAIISLLYSEYRLLESPSISRVLLTGILFGITLLIKGAAILILPFCFLICLLWSLSRIPYVLASLVFGIIFMHLAYGFPGLLESGYIDEEGFYFTVLRILSWIFPEPYIFSMYWQTAHVNLGHSFIYLLGNFSKDGFFFYYPLVFLIKLSTAEIFAGAIACYLFFKQVDKKSLFLLLACLWWILVVMLFVKIQIGFRYLLPALPLLICFIAVQIGKLNNFRLKTISVLVLLQISLSFYSLGNHLAFSNIFLGGYSQTYKYLSDSNVDWGQDLTKLSKWQKEKNIDNLYFSYFGTANPKHYGIKAKYFSIPRFQAWQKFVPDNEKIVNWKQIPTGAWIAVSVTNYHGSYLAKKDRLDWLKDYQLIDQVGGSILIFRNESK